MGLSVATGEGLGGRCYRGEATGKVPPDGGGLGHQVEISALHPGGPGGAVSSPNVAEV